MVNLTVEDIQYHGDVILVKFPYTKTHKERPYTLLGAQAAIFKKYAYLRPTKVPTNRFFLNFQNGKCTVQVIGKNKIAKCPYKIATYLGLPDSTRYTAQAEINSWTNVDPTLDTNFRLSESACRRAVEMITIYCVGTTPVSIVVLILVLVTNIFSTLAVNISKILVIYFYYYCFTGKDVL